MQDHSLSICLYNFRSHPHPKAGRISKFLEFPALLHFWILSFYLQIFQIPASSRFSNLSKFSNLNSNPLFSPFQIFQDQTLPLFPPLTFPFTNSLWFLRLPRILHVAIFLSHSSKISKSYHPSFLSLSSSFSYQFFRSQLLFASLLL